jgi:hypothetical protein
MSATVVGTTSAARYTTSTGTTRAALQAFLKGRTEWPTYREFERVGLKTLRDRVTRHGGARHWAQQIGVAYVQHRPGYAPIWTEEHIRERLGTYLAGKKEWPSHKQSERDGQKGTRSVSQRAPRSLSARIYGYCPYDGGAESPAATTPLFGACSDGRLGTRPSTPLEPRARRTRLRRREASSDVLRTRSLRLARGGPPGERQASGPLLRGGGNPVDGGVELGRGELTAAPPHAERDHLGAGPGACEPHRAQDREELLVAIGHGIEFPATTLALGRQWWPVR